MADSSIANNNNALWKNEYEATEIKVIWFYFYDKRFKEVCRSKEACYTEYLFNKSMEKIKRIYSQYDPIEVKIYKLEG
jgi:hypothetical protein